MGARGFPLFQKSHPVAHPLPVETRGKMTLSQNLTRQGSLPRSQGGPGPMGWRAVAGPSH